MHTIDALHYAVRLAIEDSRALLHRQHPARQPEQLRALRAETRSTEALLRASRSARERHYFKVVAKVGGNYFSIFDGQTHFQLGTRMERTPCAGRRGAFFAYPDLAEATRAMLGHFPSSSKLHDAPRAVLCVSSDARHTRSAHGKCLLWSLTPIAEVEVRPRSAAHGEASERRGGERGTRPQPRWRQ